MAPGHGACLKERGPTLGCLWFEENVSDNYYAR